MWFERKAHHALVYAQNARPSKQKSAFFSFFGIFFRSHFLAYAYTTFFSFLLRFAPQTHNFLSVVYSRKKRALSCYDRGRGGKASKQTNNNNHDDGLHKSDQPRNVDDSPMQRRLFSLIEKHMLVACLSIVNHMFRLTCFSLLHVYNLFSLDSFAIVPSMAPRNVIFSHYPNIRRPSENQIPPHRELHVNYNAFYQFAQCLFFLLLCVQTHENKLRFVPCHSALITIRRWWMFCG